MDSERLSLNDEEKGKVENAILAASSGDDPSSKMWILSITHADKHDSAMVERWKADMDGILIYTGVFSATVAAFLIESYKSLKPDPTDVSSSLLQQVTQELAGISNGDHFTPPSLDSFKPPRYAIQVNILWFLSLVITLSCGLGATLVQSWVRRYDRLTQHSDTPAHRVRVRTFLFAGIKEFHVRLIVENISLLLHAAIFLFFAGLVEFLLNINDEVAHVVLAVICFFAAIYVTLTFLPVIFQQCPFQTPLTSVFWYIGHITTIIVLFPFTCSSHVRTRIKELWSHTTEGFDKHIMKAVVGKKVLDKQAVRMTLSMCRDDGDVEAFLEAIPGYLQIDNNVGTRIDDIGSLLKLKGTDMPLGQRMVHLLSTCINGNGKMDDVARRHRAITCSHVVLELSKAVSSLTVKGLTLDLPYAIGHKLQHLSRDHDPEIAFAAVKTIAVLERALLEQLSDTEVRMNPDRSAELVEVLAAAIGENDRASPRYQPGQRNDDWSDGRLIAATEFTANILELLKRPWHPSREDIKDIKLVFEELCRGLKDHDFSPATQERFVNMLSETWETHSTSAPTGTLSLNLL
ncbi:hypothetical protein F5888DRAFT_1742581 [Russula emetica]|nr:hypothetical protein F5888DRAFT_1742581 [Russula emetica]